MSVDLDKWARWERTRKGGRTRFILLWWVFGWALTCGILMALYNMYVEHMPLWLGGLIVVPFLIGGYPAGALFWSSMESKYLAARQAAEQRQTLASVLQEVRQLRDALEERDRSDQR